MELARRYHKGYNCIQTARTGRGGRLTAFWKVINPRLAGEFKTWAAVEKAIDRAVRRRGGGTNQAPSKAGAPGA